jgi:hypothetical protein
MDLQPKIPVSYLSCVHPEIDKLGRDQGVRIGHFWMGTDYCWLKCFQAVALTVRKCWDLVKGSKNSKVFRQQLIARDSTEEQMTWHSN